MNEDQVKELLQRYDNLRELMTRMNADMLQIKALFSELDKKGKTIESQMSRFEHIKDETEERAKTVERYLMRAQEYERKLEDQETSLAERRIDTSELEKKLSEKQKKDNKKLNDQLKNIQNHNEVLGSVVMDYIINEEGISFDENAVLLDAEDIYITLIDITFYNKKIIVKMAMETEDSEVTQILATGVTVNEAAIKRSLPITFVGMSNEMVIYLFIDNSLIPVDVKSIEDIDSVGFTLKVKTTSREYIGKTIKADTDGHFIDEEKYDPNQIYTITELSSIIEEEPLIVEKRTWTNDYCFVVKNIDGNYAKGKVYKDGKFSKESSYPLGQKAFRIYDGKYRNLIKAQETDLELPFK